MSFSLKSLSDLFAKFSTSMARVTGHAGTFVLAAAVVLVWAITGPLFGYSDTWQLVINTGTTIVTFLMVFLIQNSQNRDTCAMQVKLDELIRATRGAQNSLLDLEELSEEELSAFRDKYEALAKAAREGRHSDDDNDSNSADNDNSLPRFPK
jgi:low affinity Fe/Cu permease